MDNKHISSIETISVTANDALPDSELRNCTISKSFSEKCNNAQNKSTQNVIDLNDVPKIYISSDEDDAPEQFSVSVEQTDSQLPLVTDVGSSIDCEKESASVLHERTQRLLSEMTGLREKLNQELALWRKEKEEFQFLRERSDALAFEEATAAARAAAAAYAVESPLSNDLSNIVNITSEKSVRELAILEYEKNLAKYHDPYSFEQAEQRYNSYKRALVDAYKQKILEVERLCDEELENIRHNASCLQPFKEIASQWSIDENDRGDSQRARNDQLDMEQFKFLETKFNNDWCIYGKIDHEVNMVPEILSSRFN